MWGLCGRTHLHGWWSLESWWSKEGGGGEQRVIRLLGMGGAEMQGEVDAKDGTEEKRRMGRRGDGVVGRWKKVEIRSGVVGWECDDDDREGPVSRWLID